VPTCIRCGDIKADEEFRFDAPRDRWFPYCRACERAYKSAWQRERRLADPVWQAERVRRDRERHPERFAAYDRKRGAGHAASELRRRDQKALTSDGSVDREEIYKRDNAICGLCGEFVPWDLFEIDHIVPLSRGGRHIAVNVQVSHGRCNRRKHDKPLVAATVTTVEGT
jgi:5-methylcytosine-specific restriction endonuclease McrA